MFVAMSKSANTLNLDDLLTEVVSVDDSMSTISFGNIAASGYTYASNSIDWSNISIGSGSSINSSITSRGVMELQGEDADIKINGRSLMDSIAALEERLNILVPNPELEKEWDELRELGERYRELERKCKQKGEMWKKLKSMPPPEQL